jgi:hypothetical protein
MLAGSSIARCLSLGKQTFMGGEMIRIIIFILLAFYFSCSEETKENTDNSVSSFTLNIKSEQADKNIGLKVIDEISKEKASVSFDLTPNSDKTDSSGNYTKVLDINLDRTYSILIVIDTNNNFVQDSNDMGQFKANIKAQTTFDNFQQLKEISIIGVNDSLLANKQVACFINVFDYTIDYFSKTSIDYFTFIYGVYNQSGEFNNLALGLLPAGNYGNILCLIDNDSNDKITTGDYYQFINEKVLIDSVNKSYSLTDWQTY